LSFLTVQFFFFTEVTEISLIIGHPTTFQTVFCVVRMIFWPLTFWIGLRIRSKIARLSDEKLSNYIALYVFRGGMIMGLGQLSFLLFASIQCHITASAEGESWRTCRRTLYSQTGLGGMICFFILLKAVSGMAPRHLLEKHMVSLKRVVTMNLNVYEFTTFAGYCTVVCCGLFLLGNYGAEGDFHTKWEERFCFIVMALGTTSLLVISVWKGILIRKDMKLEESLAAKGHNPEQHEARQDDSFEVSKLSWFYVIISVFGSTFESAISVVAGVRNPDSEKLEVENIAHLLMPIIAIFMIGGFFAKPRLNSKPYVWFLRIHFLSIAWVTEAMWLVWELRRGHPERIALPIAYAICWTGAFHKLSQFRTSIGNLCDSELTNFLINTLFASGMQTFVPVLFVNFKTTQCFFEDGTAACTVTALCSAYISCFLICLWVVKIVHGAVPSALRSEFTVSLKKIAVLDLPIIRLVQGSLMSVVGSCGLLLFAMMKNNRIDLEATVNEIGAVGIICGAGTLICEVVCYDRAKQHMQTSTGLQDKSPVQQEKILECSWFFLIINFIFTNAYWVMWCVYAVSLDDRLELLSDIISPSAVLCFTLTFFMKPLRKDKLYRRFLYFQFVSFATFSELGYAVTKYRKGSILTTLFGLCRIPIWFFFYRNGIKLRDSVASLPKEKIHEFLVDTIMQRGLGVIVTMVFFSFETISCLAVQGLGENAVLCANTSHASAFLSGYLVLFVMQSIAVKAVPTSISESSVLTFEEVARLDNFKKRQKIQGFLIITTGLCSFFLLSYVGSEAQPNSSVAIVGSVGGILLCGQAIMVMFVLTTKMKHRQERTGQSLSSLGKEEADEEENEKKKKKKGRNRLSLGAIEDEGLVGGFL